MYGRMIPQNNSRGLFLQLFSRKYIKQVQSAMNSLYDYYSKLPIEEDETASAIPKVIPQALSMSQLNRDRLGVWGNGDNVIPSCTSGLERLRNGNLNKGLAFTVEERQALGLHGLLAPRVKTQEQQLEHCRLCFDRITDNLDKYIYLIGLLDRNEKLFYRFLRDNVDELMPVMYTPVVGLACQKFGLVYYRPRGLYVTIHDKGHVYDILKNWPETDVRVIVFTDGERILGLGDLGAYGMGIPIGKLALYTALAGIKPHQCLPVTIDVGTNNQKLLDDPLYIGLKQKRVRGESYDELIDEFMQAVVQRWGQNTLVQFEDFGNQNAFRLLETHRRKYCTFNDDIQGTASVAVSGLLAAMRKTKTKLSQHIFLFQGAGEANIGIAELCIMAMAAEGVSHEDALKKIFMVDSKGLIVKNRPAGGISTVKEQFAQNVEPIEKLGDVVKKYKPSILIGAAAVGGAFTPEILQEMAKNNTYPIIFALSNPTSHAECTAEDAYKYTNGNVIFASGSPFPPVTYKGKTYHTGQGNNAYIFPGIGLGVICAGIRTIGDDLFLIAAEAIASMVTDEDLDSGCIYPPLSKITEVSIKIAVTIAEYAYTRGSASVFPKPDNVEELIRSQMYNTDYDRAVPPFYPVPI